MLKFILEFKKKQEKIVQLIFTSFVFRKIQYGMMDIRKHNFRQLIFWETIAETYHLVF